MKMYHIKFKKGSIVTCYTPYFLKSFIFMRKIDSVQVFDFDGNLLDTFYTKKEIKNYLRSLSE